MLDATLKFEYNWPNSMDLIVVIAALPVFTEWVASTSLMISCFVKAWLAAGGGRKRQVALAAGLAVGLGR